VHAQAAAKPAAAPAAATTQGSPSQLVLSNSNRIVATLEKRRSEFKSNPASLDKFISTEFNTMFDRDYAARLVLGRHGRGASDADVKLFADALADSLMSRYGSALLSFDTG
jgi:phospholipid transport system substrate-binding protein